VLLALLAFGAHADDLEKGKSIYVARCQSCHGSTGKGDGPAAAAFPKKPRDFSMQDYWTAMNDDQLRLYILQGKPGTIMRGFPMPDDQLLLLVAYLKSFSTSATTATPEQ
jgi:mono/diheme cytochrome c family protein